MILLKSFRFDRMADEFCFPIPLCIVVLAGLVVGLDLYDGPAPVFFVEAVHVMHLIPVSPRPHIAVIHSKDVVLIDLNRCNVNRSMCVGGYVQSVGNAE